jgi:MFS family permease
MPLWGILTDKHGNVKIMQTTAWLIPLIPIAWIVSPNIYWLIFLQIVSGITWAGFNLAAGNFTYDAVTPQRMSICSAYMLVLSGAGAFLGATVGGLLASLPIKFMNIFFFVFVVSGIARLIVISLMLKKIKEVRPVKPLKKAWFVWNFVLFSPRTLNSFMDVITMPVNIISRANKKINQRILKNFK